MRGSLPLYDPTFREEVAGFAEEISLTDLAMIRVMNWPKVLGTYLEVRIGSQSVPDGSFSFAVSGQGGYTVAVRDGQVLVTEAPLTSGPDLTPEKAVDLFFSMGGAVNCADPWLKALLPLPFHMGTMDHF